MGMGMNDAADWDFVEYAKVLSVWNARQKEENGDESSTGETEPPPIEWMIADDVRALERGHKVN